MIGIDIFYIFIYIPVGEDELLIGLTLEKHSLEDVSAVSFDSYAWRSTCFSREPETRIPCTDHVFNIPTTILLTFDRDLRMHGF